jgi:putative ABC transport system substrate-binding protein
MTTDTDTVAAPADFLAEHQGLSETGYVEGQSVAIEYRWAEGHYDRLPALFADLLARKVDAIVAGGGSKYKAAYLRARARSATRSYVLAFAEPRANRAGTGPAAARVPNREGSRPAVRRSPR